MDSGAPRRTRGCCEALRELQAGNYREAMAAGVGDADRAVAPLCALVLGEAFLDTGDSARAEPEALRAVSMVPDDPASHLLLARVRLTMSKAPQAVSDARWVVEHAPSAEAFVVLGLVSEDLSDWQHAAESYQAAIELSPSDPRAHLLLARMLERRGDRARALREARSAVDIAERCHEPACSHMSEEARAVIDRLSRRVPFDGGRN